MTLFHRATAHPSGLSKYHSQPSRINQTAIYIATARCTFPYHSHIKTFCDYLLNVCLLLEYEYNLLESKGHMFTKYQSPSMMPSNGRCPTVLAELVKECMFDKRTWSR